MINLVFFGGRHTRYHSYNFSVKSLIAIIALFLSIAFLLGGLFVYWWTDADQRSLHLSLAEQLNKDLSAEKSRLEVVRKKTQEGLESMTSKIGELQARLMRIDALGSRLIPIAKLDKKEFNFDEAPSLGGPEVAEINDEGVRVIAVDVTKVIDDLDQQISDRQQQLAIIESLLTNRKLENQAFIAGKPVRKGWLSSPFGRRIDPFTGRLAWHEGVDYAAPDGSDIIATAAGVVIFAGHRLGYGNMVEIDHGNGYTTRYAHAKRVLVKKGDIINKGERVALIGSTGRSTGPHVHFEVRKHRRALDPARYIFRASN